MNEISVAILYPFGADTSWIVYVCPAFNNFPDTVYTDPSDVQLTSGTAFSLYAPS